MQERSGYSAIDSRYPAHGVNPRRERVFPSIAPTPLRSPHSHRFDENAPAVYLLFTTSSALPMLLLRPLLRPFFAVAVLAVLAGCGTSGPVTGPSSATEQAHRLPAMPTSETEARLLDAASEWMGTPYRFGGTTKNGVDCSALVRAVYAGAFGLRLTRSTRTQVREGREVGKHELRPGDLVFFRTGRNQRHVGIYLAGDRLLHASSSRNRVMIDDLGQGHFQQTYWTARRLLDVEPSAPPPARVVATPRAPEPVAPVRAGPARPGW